MKKLRSLFNTQHLKDGRTSEGKKGFTLLLAALVASIVLAIGSAIFSIALKQVELSSVGRDSQLAFYAADTAAECGLFWDVRTDIHSGLGFATSSASHSPSSITCAQQTISIPSSQIVASATAATTTFIYAPGGYCAQITIAKYQSSGSDSIMTVIRADGYSTTISNVANASTQCNLTQAGNAIAKDPSALQRSVELRY